jgi:hypothetical protein
MHRNKQISIRLRLGLKDLVITLASIALTILIIVFHASVFGSSLIRLTEGTPTNRPGFSPTNQELWYGPVAGVTLKFDDPRRKVSYFDHNASRGSLAGSVHITGTCLVPVYGFSVIWNAERSGYSLDGAFGPWDSVIVPYRIRIEAIVIFFVLLFSLRSCEKVLHRHVVKRRRSLGQCPHCKYLLAATDSNGELTSRLKKCPECGSKDL